MKFMQKNGFKLATLLIVFSEYNQLYLIMKCIQKTCRGVTVVKCGGISNENVSSS